MDEQKQTVSTEQSSSNDTTQQETPSLEQVYQKFNVEAEAQSFQPQAQTQQQPQPQRQEVAVPDPVLDAEGFKKWSGNQSQFLQQALTSLKGELTALRVERLKAGEEADIKSAVNRFRSVTGEDIDEDMAEVALGQKARKDPRFLAVYQNRGKNPAAWSAAIAAYANEFKSKTQFKIDPTIAENQRAAKQSIGSQAKQSKEEPTGDEAHFQGKTGREFDRTWRNYVDR
jgi:hypothetical protein